MSLIWVTKANYVQDYQIALEFNDNKKGIVDFKEHLNDVIFHPLQKVEFFKKFTLNDWTIEWDNGADFSPEFLVEKLN